MLSIFIHNIANYIFYPTKYLLSIGNSIFFLICLCCGSLIGSGVSIYVIMGIIFGTGHLLLRNIPMTSSKSVLVCALAFASYIAAEALASLANSGPGNLKELIEDLPFLGILPLYAVVFADREKLLANVEKGAAAAAIARLWIVDDTPFRRKRRTELFGGNAGVLAVLSSVLLAFNCVAARRNSGQMSWVFIIAAVASIGLILSTGTRGMFPGIVLIPAVVLLALGGKGLHRPTARAAAFVFIALLGVGTMAYKALEIRAAVTGGEITAIKADRYDTPIGLRLLLWRVGLDMFLESPLTGAGPGNAQLLMPARTKALSGTPVSSSHFHNAVINEMARAGLVGLAALISMFAVPFAVCYRAAKDGIAKCGLAVLCGIQSAYILSGLTGIMLGHDILDAVYLCAVVLALYLVFPEPGRAQSLAWA